MIGPAKVTAACDEVGQALNHLRQDGGSMADSDTLGNVEALERYLDKVDGTGLCFTMLSARISYGFVYALLGQLISTVTFILPVLLVLINSATVEEYSSSLSA